jgi:para-nitrobenzyl esterase
MNRGPLLGVLVFVLTLIGCGGSSPITTPPPTGCTNTTTVKCTQSGAVQGVAAANLYAFRGIPFAAPPVGTLRWKAPQPPASWTDVRDTSTFGNECPQFELNTGHYGGDEDCLTLNIFISQTPATQPQPVLVFSTAEVTLPETRTPRRRNSMSRL